MPGSFTAILPRHFDRRGIGLGIEASVCIDRQRKSLIQDCRIGPLRKKRDRRAPSDAMPVQQRAEGASALEEAHSRGILHRHLKPANILVTSNGTAKLLDSDW